MINRVILAGHVSQYGPKLTYTEQGKPQCSFTLVLTKGEFRTFIPVLCVGAKAEDVAEMLEGNDLVLLEGSLSWKAGRTKDAGKLQVVTFDVERLVTHGATAPAQPELSPN
jgi:single-stranded DNA-binding protein